MKYQKIFYYSFLKMFHLISKEKFLEKMRKYAVNDVQKKNGAVNDVTSTDVTLTDCLKYVRTEKVDFCNGVKNSASCTIVVPIYNGGGASKALVAIIDKKY